MESGVAREELARTGLAILKPRAAVAKAIPVNNDVLFMIYPPP